MDNTPRYYTLLSAQRHLDGALVLSVSGEVDLANVSSLREHLKTAIETAKNLVVDLRDLRYIDSSGIAVLLEARRALARDGRSIALAAAPPMVQRILTIVRLEQVIPVFPTVEAAVESLRISKGAAGQ